MVICSLVDELVAFAAVLAPVIGLQRFRRDLVVRDSSFCMGPVGNNLLNDQVILVG